MGDVIKFTPKSAGPLKPVVCTPCTPVFDHAAALLAAAGDIHSRTLDAMASLYVGPENFEADNG